MVIFLPADIISVGGSLFYYANLGGGVIISRIEPRREDIGKSGGERII
jgi:hypothetical protein